MRVKAQPKGVSGIPPGRRGGASDPGLPSQRYALPVVPENFLSENQGIYGRLITMIAQCSVSAKSDFRNIS
jgi:hypothetical protein